MTPQEAIAELERLGKYGPLPRVEVFEGIAEVIKQLDERNEQLMTEQVDGMAAILLDAYKQGMTDAAAIIGNERSFDTAQHAMLRRLHVAVLSIRDTKTI